MPTMNERFEQHARVVAVALLALGCFLVIQPFMGAIIFAGIDQRYPEKILVGGGLTALLAISADLALSRIERGLRGRTA